MSHANFIFSSIFMELLRMLRCLSPPSPPLALVTCCRKDFVMIPSGVQRSFQQFNSTESDLLVCERPGAGVGSLAFGVPMRFSRRRTQLILSAASVERAKVFGMKQRSVVVSPNWYLCLLSLCRLPKCSPWFVDALPKRVSSKQDQKDPV